AFIKVLNSPGSTVVLDQPLLIVSGNCETKFNLKALLIIVSKLFYLKDNDLVVNTRSMYSGTKREIPVQFLFDDATDVDHFHYFKNKKTNDGILMALKATGTALVPGFSLLDSSTIAAMDRNALLKLDGGKIFSDTVTGTKPIAIVLPGIMGSNLSNEENTIWINYLRFLAGGLKKLDIKSTDIKAPSIVSTSYKQLVNYLSSDYDVVTFPFDWRIQLNKVAATLNDKIIKLLAFRQPIKIIGHSMGGVLVRDFLINYPDTWKKLNDSDGFKLLFLGAPLGGSYRIPFVLMGRDAIIEKLAKIDIFHTKKDLLGMFSGMPGLLSLLPVAVDGEPDFADPATWQQMIEPLGDWPVPGATDLKDFKKYRDNILVTLDSIDFKNASYIAGKDSSTPCGYRIDTTNSGKELVFLSTTEGDQSVTWESGIPKKMIEENSVYYVNVSHGALANEPSIFKGISEIIASGATSSLSKIRPETRGGKKIFKTPDQHDFDITPEGVENTLLGLDTKAKDQVVGEMPLRVRVSNGDLRYASYPLLAGHFQSDGILSAEKQIDGLMHFALSEMKNLSLYPGEIGTSESFIQCDNDFNGAIIVGLGSSGSFSAYQLTLTVEQGVSKYLLNLDRNETALRNVNENAGDVGISSLIIGSGYGGLSIEDSLRAIMQGVQNANVKMKKIRPEFSRTVQYLEFIELYEDAALSCFYSLSKIEKEESSSLKVVKDTKKMKILLGSKKRIPSQNSDGWWNRITVQLEKGDHLSTGSQALLFNASTGGAREQQRKLYSSPKIIDKIIEDISSSNMWSPELARTIFELLIPNDFKDQLTRQCNINWIVDKYTASYPWELLQDRIADSIPLCVNAGMIRQLATQDDRVKINPVTKNTALVIGDPFLDGYVTQLPGAYAEAEMVAATLTANSFQPQLILRGSAPAIIKNLFADDYKIIHLAGHGNFSPDAPETSGMVIGKEVFLTTAEIAQMSMTPELVFVNCCFLGKTEGAAEELYQSRYKLAANIGTQLIENGVKAVVVAGWAVDDAAAMDFTRTFYSSMFEGDTFGESVHKARKVIYDKYHTANNTWGAYQCYGDPFYRFDTRHHQNKKYAPVFVIAEEAEIALNNLDHEMGMGHYDENELLSRLQAISDAVDNAALRTAKITEKEAFIYADMYYYDKAIEKFQLVMTAEAANFSVRTLEKYCNVRAKKCVNDFLAGGNPKKLLKEMDAVIKDLTMLLDISQTSERYSLIASAFKRKLILSSSLAAKTKAIGQAAYFYMKAHTSPKNSNPAYSLCNWMEMENILVLLGDRKWNEEITVGKESYKLFSEEHALSELKKTRSVLSKNDDDMDYWNLLSISNIDLCRLIIDLACSTDEKLWDDALLSYRKVWSKAGSKGTRLSEVEHLELLSDGLAQSKKRDVVRLKKKIDNLKNELIKIS
ncbi:MAG: CHAT domain-containing protein, partial [Ginsengibacter sp.]